VSAPVPVLLIASGSGERESVKEMLERGKPAIVSGES